MNLPRLCLLAVLLAPISASAHDLWIERDADGWALLRGHRHSAHEGTDAIPYDPAILRNAACFGPTGDSLSCEAPAAYPARLADVGQSAVCFLVSSGYWTKTPYGTRNAPPAQVEHPLRSWFSIESVKRLDGWTAAFAEPLTGDLEIVPFENPLELEIGEKLRVQVMLSGAPCENAIVAYFGEPRGKTGPDGTLNVRLRQPGLQMIQATLTEPDPTGVVDEVVRAATLNFLLEGDA